MAPPEEVRGADQGILQMYSGEVSAEALELAGVISNLGHHALLAGGEAPRVLSNLLPSNGEQNELVLEVACLLFGQYLEFAGGSSPTIRAAVSEQLLPALQSTRGCLRSHRAFHRASALSPLLKTGCVLGAQLTQAALFALEGIGETEFALSAEELAAVLLEAVVLRAERFLPVDSKRIMAAHRSFQERQARITSQMRERGGVEPIAPTPSPQNGGQARKWQSEALRLFWEHRCLPKAFQGNSEYQGLVPLDVASVLLLQATFADQSHENREKVMRALAFYSSNSGGGGMDAPGLLNPERLDESVGKEIEQAGGLRNWVYDAVLGIPQQQRPDEDGPGGRAEELHKTSLEGAGMPSSLLGFTGTTEGGVSSLASTTADNHNPAFFGSSQLGSSLGGMTLLRREPQAGGSGAFSGPPEDDGLGGRSRKAFDVLDAAEAGDLARSERILKADMAAPTRRNETFGDTALHLAVPRDFGASGLKSRRSAPITNALLQKGADPNAQDHVQTGPLHAAAACGNLEAARTLLANGASMKLEDRWRQTPLHKAAYSGQLQVAELFLADARAQGTLDLPDAWGTTPLHMAAAQGQYAMLKLLLKYGARLESEDQLGQTPLYHAAKGGFYDLAKELLAAGAMAERADRAGRTPRDAARDRGHTDLITLLRFFAREQQQQLSVKDSDETKEALQQRTVVLMRGDLSAY